MIIIGSLVKLTAAKKETESHMRDVISPLDSSFP
jgi:hypothetical protein